MERDGLVMGLISLFFFFPLCTFFAALCFRAVSGKSDFFTSSIEDVSPNDPNIPQGGNFCPYCGAGAGADHVYCKKCGKQIR